MNRVIGFQVGAARAYLEKKFGGPIAEVESVVSCSTSASIILGSNGDRVGLVFVGAGNFGITLALASNVVANQGVVLNAGGFIGMDIEDDHTLPARAWYGIATGGASNIYILEILRVSLPESEGT